MASNSLDLFLQIDSLSPSPSLSPAFPSFFPFLEEGSHDRTCGPWTGYRGLLGVSTHFPTHSSGLPKVLTPSPCSCHSLFLEYISALSLFPAQSYLNFRGQLEPLAVRCPCLGILLALWEYICANTLVLIILPVHLPPQPVFTWKAGSLSFISLSPASSRVRNVVRLH